MLSESPASRGVAVFVELFGEAPPPQAASFQIEVVYGRIWSRDGLTRHDRLVCTLAVLSATRQLRQLPHYIGAALRHGFSAETIREILLHPCLYTGLTMVEEALDVAARIFEANGVAVPSGPDYGSPAERAEQGEEVLAFLHGTLRGKQGYASPANRTTSELYPFAVEVGYGHVWNRPGLDRRSRMLCALSVFTALRLSDQIGKFGISAMNIGLKRSEVIEAVIQTVPYAGFAPALSALTILDASLAES